MVSNLRMMILKVLGDTPASGYKIVKDIEERTGWKPSYGSVYPVLEDMEVKGFLSVKKKGRKKVYSLTSEGKREAEAADGKKEEFFESMKENVKVMGELTGQDVSAIMMLVERFQEGEDPLEPLSPEIFEFRNTLIKKALSGLEDEEAAEIKAILRKNIENLRSM